MQLGETIATYDVALALRGESGKFEVTSPTGEIYHVTCDPNHSISSLEWSGNQTGSQPFLVRKVVEPVLQELGSAVAAGSAAGAAQTRTDRAPFLLESQESQTRMPSNADGVSLLPKVVDDESQNSEIAGLELLYVESDPRTNLPSACVCVRNVRQNAGQWITSPSTTLNEFDAEIRRLHSQLDEIRYRARKKFYQATQAVAAGA